jgi:type VI secretion system secreted protein VgrG
MAQASRTLANRQLSIATAAGDDKMFPVAMHGTEALGRLFEFVVDLFTTGGEPVAAKDILGTNMTIGLLANNSVQRYFNGFVSRFELTSVEQVKGENATYYYRVTLVPWLWFLTRNSNCRIYQNLSVPDIIKSVMKDLGYTDVKDSGLSETYRVWEYCVQYRETDFNFVSRLMENEGIYYYFEHADGKHTLVLCDSPTSHAKVTNYETLTFDKPGAAADGDTFAWDWVHGNEFTTNSYALTDYNYLQPKTNLLQSVAAQNTEGTSKFELYDYPGAYTTATDGTFYARTRMEEQESTYSVAHATSSGRGIFAGATFELDGHPVVAKGDFLITAVTYQLRGDDVRAKGGGGKDPKKAKDDKKETEPEEDTPTYLTKITVMPAKVPFRPARITPKPFVHGPQTAMVVGASGDEICTFANGCAKVKFMWDFATADDDTAGCWIRVSQNWAGKTWGIFFAPRVGQEVIVDFLEGDPDRPIITGRVYNADNPTPYPLPANQTMSTIKSNSSKGGEGFNEFRFEDKKGSEQIFIHAEKNMDIRVKNDRFESILNNRHLVVIKDKFEHVQNKRHEIVDVDHMEHIKGDRHLTVDGKEAVAITGSKSLQVTGDVIEQFKGNHSEVVTSDYYVKADNIVIEGMTNVTIKVGNNYIAIDKSGISIGCNESSATIDTSSMGDTSITSTKGFNVSATAKVAISGTGGVSIESSATAEFKGSMVTVSGDATLTLKGGMVAIN